MSRVAIIGTGYVGLTTGTYLAHIGHDVTCADVVPEKVQRLNQGEVPILEAGLDELVRSGLESGRLRFVLGSAAAVPGVEFVFLCLPTPQGEDGAADLSYIEDAATEIGPMLEAESIVINKSTVPVGSTRLVQRALARDDVSVVSNPEFLREGSAVHDSLNPDRIVIGADDAAAASRVARLFDGINAPLIVTDPASAELIKYASNAFLATKISYVNAIANLCEAVGADVREVVLGMGYDKRIGFEFLRPGPGWGGSCFHPDETLLVRRGDSVRLLSFAQLFEDVEHLGPDGWEVLSWRPTEPRPEFLRVGVFTRRPFDGDLLEIRTKMGRRVLATPDHPFFTCDGVQAEGPTPKLAAELTPADWLPVAQGFPLLDREPPLRGSPFEALPLLDRTEDEVRAQLGPDQLMTLACRGLDKASIRTLADIRRHGLSLDDGRYTLARAHSSLPGSIAFDWAFWRVVGLYLAEGTHYNPGSRERLIWTFHHTNEEDLVNEVVSFWASYGVAAIATTAVTSRQVVLNSPILATWFAHVLGLGDRCHTKRIPDIAWGQPETYKRALLSGLWDGDGSWSLVNGGPSLVLEYGTVSKDLADGMLRLLGDLGIVARVKVGRTTKSTRDAYWLVISGADQVDAAWQLIKSNDRIGVELSLARLKRRIEPTGYRRLSKNAAWLRVDRITPVPFQGDVYSLGVPESHSLVLTGGLITSNCFPKDTQALVRIAEGAGYDFGLLEGVITVNIEQYDRIADKVEASVGGGSLQGRTVAVWGLTFKARTDDLRDSPSLAVISRLKDRGAVVRAFDPTVHGERLADPRLAGIDLVSDPYAACDGADLVVLLTEWDEFRWLDFDKVRGLLADPVMVDARNLLDPAALRRRGFRDVGGGRP